MGEYKGVFLKEEEEIFDPPLIELLGHRYRDTTNENSVEENPDHETNEDNTEVRPWEKLKKPVLFTALVILIGTSAHFGLMDPCLAVPGMCVCSACFGWNVGRYHG